MFGSRKRYWGVLYHGALYLYENAKAFKEEDKIVLKGATLKQHNNSHVFLLESELMSTSSVGVPIGDDCANEHKIDQIRPKINFRRFKPGLK